MSITVAIVTDTPGWHGARLRDAFRRRGCDAPWLQLQDCVIDTSLRGGVRLPGFGGRLPNAVFVRGIPGGSLQKVVFHLNILHILQALGVPVYNDGRAIERSVDKALTSALLARDGIRTPPTWVCGNRDEAESILRLEFAAGHRVVVKPLFGAQGEGVQRLERVSELPSAADCDGVYYLQRFVDTGDARGRDWRVLVVGGRAVAAMQRIGLDWISNVARGGEVRSVPLSAELAEPAERAVAVLDMDYGGVDLIRDADGRIHVLEVNSVPAWRGLQTVVDMDIAQHLTDDLLRRYLQHPALEVVS